MWITNRNFHSFQVGMQNGTVTLGKIGVIRMNQIKIIELMIEGLMC